MNSTPYGSQDNYNNYNQGMNSQQNEFNNPNQPNNYYNNNNYQMQSQNIPPEDYGNQDSNYNNNMNMTHYNSSQQPELNIEIPPHDKKSMISSHVTSPGAQSSEVHKDSKSSNPKPIELKTKDLFINGIKVGQDKIITKIHLGNKQFVYEFSDEQQQQGENSKGQGQFLKKKFEILFKNITNIYILTKEDSIQVETEVLPNERIQNETVQQKTSIPYKNHKFSQDLHGMQGNQYIPSIDLEAIKKQEGKLKFQSIYMRHQLTKQAQGRTPHIEKLKKQNLPLNVDGEQIQEANFKMTPGKGYQRNNSPSITSDQINNQMYQNDESMSSYHQNHPHHHKKSFDQTRSQIQQNQMQQGPIGNPNNNMNHNNNPSMPMHGNNNYSNSNLPNNGPGGPGPGNYNNQHQGNYNNGSNSQIMNNGSGNYNDQIPSRGPPQQYRNNNNSQQYNPREGMPHNMPQRPPSQQNQYNRNNPNYQQQGINQRQGSGQDSPPNPQNYNNQNNQYNNNNMRNQHPNNYQNMPPNNQQGHNQGPHPNYNNNPNQPNNGDKMNQPPYYNQNNSQSNMPPYSNNKPNQARSGSNTNFPPHQLPNKGQYGGSNPDLRNQNPQGPPQINQNGPNQGPPQNNQIPHQKQSSSYNQIPPINNQMNQNNNSGSNSNIPPQYQQNNNNSNISQIQHPNLKPQNSQGGNYNPNQHPNQTQKPPVNLQPPLIPQQSINQDSAQLSQSQLPNKQKNPVKNKDKAGTKKDDRSLFPNLIQGEIPNLQKNIEKFSNQNNEEKLQYFADNFKLNIPSSFKTVFRCPIYKCQKEYKQNQFIKHMNKKHKELSQLMTITPQGTFDFKPELLNYAYSLAQAFPKFTDFVQNNIQQSLNAKEIEKQNQDNTQNPQVVQQKPNKPPKNRSNNNNSSSNNNNNININMKMDSQQNNPDHNIHNNNNYQMSQISDHNNMMNN